MPTHTENRDGNSTASKDFYLLENSFCQPHAPLDYFVSRDQTIDGNIRSPIFLGHVDHIQIQFKNSTLRRQA